MKHDVCENTIAVFEWMPQKASNHSVSDEWIENRRDLETGAEQEKETPAKGSNGCFGRFRYSSAASLAATNLILRPLITLGILRYRPERGYRSS